MIELQGKHFIFNGQAFVYMQWKVSVIDNARKTASTSIARLAQPNIPFLQGRRRAVDPVRAATNPNSSTMTLILVPPPGIRVTFPIRHSADVRDLGRETLPPPVLGAQTQA